MAAIRKLLGTIESPQIMSLQKDAVYALDFLIKRSIWAPFLSFDLKYTANIARIVARHVAETVNKQIRRSKDAAEAMQRPVHRFGHAKWEFSRKTVAHFEIKLRKGAQIGCFLGTLENAARTLHVSKVTWFSWFSIILFSIGTMQLYCMIRKVK